MIKVESVTIRAAKNGYTVEPQLPFDMPMSMDSPGDAGAMKARREASRPRIATSVEDALSQAGELLGVPCDVQPQVDAARGYDEKDSALTSDPTEMF